MITVTQVNSKEFLLNGSKEELAKFVDTYQSLLRKRKSDFYTKTGNDNEIKWYCFGSYAYANTLAIEDFNKYVNIFNGGSIENNIEVTASQKPYRVCVAVGQYNIGDEIGGHKITSFGKSWRASPDDFSVHGISPDANEIQYAYFN